jgi:hypothetical protein
MESNKQIYGDRLDLDSNNLSASHNSSANQLGMRELPSPVKPPPRAAKMPKLELSNQREDDINSVGVRDFIKASKR